MLQSQTLVLKFNSRILLNVIWMIQNMILLKFSKIVFCITSAAFYRQWNVLWEYVLGPRFKDSKLISQAKHCLCPQNSYSCYRMGIWIREQKYSSFIMKQECRSQLNNLSYLVNNYFPTNKYKTRCFSLRTLQSTWDKTQM